ncbi:MAG: S-layer y domain protein [Firmicutes bacterium]|nr:S-layer y domain protein [Bacillota bacterium]
MKKKLVAILVLVFVLSIAGTAFAAVTGNPFVDVPANHWSYGAVKKLAAAGIIEGADGRVNGDKTLTRYEIAVMVAKAMAKEEKADAEQQALIEKLSAEYRVELQNMGIRLNKVEEKTSKINFYGYLGLRFDYGKGSAFSAPGIQAEAAHVDTYTTFKIDDNSTVGIENVFHNNLRSVGQSAGSLYDGVANSSTYTGGYNQLAHSLFVNTALDKVKFTVGQFGMIPAYGMVMSSEDFQGSRVKGVKASLVTGPVTTTLFSGKTFGLYNLGLETMNAGKYNLAEIDYALSKVTNIKAAYHDAKNANYCEMGFDTKLSSNLAFEAATAKSDLDVAANQGYYAQLKYKQAMFWAVPHSYDLFAGYRKIGANATLNGGSNSDFNGNYTYDVKGFIAGAHYVPSKMTMLTTWYAFGKTVSTNKDQKVFRTQLDFFF